jgi:hypothetical protein
MTGDRESIHRTAGLDVADGPLGAYLHGLGEDARGEAYIFTTDEVGPTGTTARVYRIVVDTDGDGFYDIHDNCTLTANADQRDTNGDGYGNACDADLDNNGTINFTDLATLKATFFGAPGPSGLVP